MSRFSMSSSSELQLSVHGVLLSFNKELLAAKSAKIDALIKESTHQERLVLLLRNIPAVPETLKIVAKFCHGFELNLTTKNVIPVICLAYYLEMTESHSNNNLIKKATTFLEERVLPSWNEIIKAFRSADENILKQALVLGLVDTCFDRLVEMALLDPCILGEPFGNLIFYEDSNNNEDEEKAYRPNARRKLFVLDWKPEDLTTLSLQLYEPIIAMMNKRGVPPQYVAASLYQYAKKWVFSSIPEWDGLIYKKRSYQRDVIEAVERLLPHEKGLLPSTLLSEMLRFAISMESSDSCRNGLETRIGKQLDQATAKDLLIPSESYTKEMQYDIDCMKRILSHFYSNYESPNSSGVILVAELIEEFLAEVASDNDLKMETFVELAKISISLSEGTHKNSDGIYRAVDIYLDKHGFLTGTEREEVCQVLDCQKMSAEACDHAAKNERLPMRFVVQVLFVTQLQMRDTITKAVEVFDDKLRREDVEEEEKEMKEGEVGFDEEEMRSEMEKMNMKVMEIEKDCLVMRKKIEGDCIHDKAKKEKVSMWKAMKRKLGCMSSFHDCKCQTKKKKHYK